MTEPVDTVHEAFSAAATAFATRPALVTDDRTVTYAALHRWMLAVAASLPDVRPDDVVGLCAGRAPAMVAAMLGILRAGGAYLSLDPRLPDRRLAQLITASGACMIVVTPELADRVRAVAPAGVDLVAIVPEPAGPAPPVPAAGTGANLAYVLYTSGSTGSPKGVLIEHRNVIALARDPFTGVRPDDVFCQLAPLHADPSAFEIWTPLLNGAAVALPPEGELSVHDVGEQLVRHQVTVLRLVAPLFALVVETNIAALRGVRLIISGGDRASERAVRRALTELPGCTVCNGYGPTETTVLALVHAMTAYDESWPSVPIGRPLGGVITRVLDEVGVDATEGELWLGGTGLARGYLGRPDLTAERFVRFADSGERMYRTGDRVRRLPDGNLEFLGRLDDQVKIRGFRVEPGEVEVALARHPAIAEAAVVYDGRLAAFVRLRHGLTADLRTYLAERLPDYLMPAVIQEVAEFPLLRNGKLDRRALTASYEGTPVREPSTESERTVAALFAQSLGHPGSFLDLGGDSLAAMQIVALVAQRLGVRLPLAAVFQAPTVAEFAALVDRTAAEPVTSVPTGLDRAPLTAGQAGLWFDDRLTNTGNYAVARTFDLRGPVAEPTLRTAVRLLADRQPALRTVIADSPEGPLQVVRTDLDPVFRFVDLAGLHDNRVRELVDATVAEPFDTGAPLLRVLLVSLGDDRFILNVTVHHVIADDWSLDILFDELSACYRAVLAGTEPDLPAPTVRFIDLAAAAHAVRERIAARTVPAVADLLRGYPGMIDLPTDRPAPEVLSGRGGRVRFDLDAGRTAALAGVARTHRVSRFMLTMAALYLLLAKYAQRRDICVGTPVAGREQPGSDRLVGYFVRMVPIRINSAARSVPELLDHVRTACLNGYEHADIPLPALAQAIGAHTGGGRFPLFQVVLAYQQRPPRAVTLPDVDVVPWDVPDGTAKFDLGFSFAEHGDTTSVVIEYSTDLFDRPTIQRMAGHLDNVLRWLATHPDDDLRTLTLLSPAEENQVRVEWNRTDLDFPRDRCLHELVSEQVARRPDKVAVIGPDETLTYAELEARSDRLAALLLRAGVALEDRVAICVPRSARLMVAILGVLKAGGAYVPLDPAYPAERLRLMEAHAAANVLIATSATRRTGIGTGIATVIDIDEPLPDDPVAPDRRPGSANIAYLIYTSGSSGRPKGVPTEHRAAINVFNGHMAWYSFNEDDVWSQFAPCGFDMAVYEQFMPLLTGATSVVVTDDERMDGRLFVDFVNRNQITVLVSSPAFLRSLGQPELPTVRALITGGEVANLPDVAYYAPRKAFINCYGPTEVTICTTSYRATGAETEPRLPIGRPQHNTALYIVDCDGQLCPVGVPGEIYVGGIGLARGYWGDPDLTADRFVTVPALGMQRLYRTGDRARWLPDGNVDFLGRLDDYVKVRGYRVEPGEIEAVLIAHPAVTQAAVLVRGESLVAFVAGGADTDELRGYLAKQLPYYMVPGWFVPVPRIPMTDHVKIDRRALAALLTDAAPEASDDAAAATSTESRVAKLCAELLGVPRVGASTDFFALGGHSLLIARLLDRVETEFDTRIGVRDFLGTPTVRGLAALVDGTAAAAGWVTDADAELDPVPNFLTVTVPASDPAAVLLTGATGFVGAFLLRELLARTTGEVVCLVRAASPAEADDRIRRAVRDHRLGIDPRDPRIVAVPADLAAPGLRLDADTCTRIADTVDMIVHAGALVNHLAPYRQLKAANVSGTAELVRLAATGRPKRFHHVSSLSVFTAQPGRTITEDTAATMERHPIGQGYSASKWVADRMVDRAVDSGLVGRLYRLGRMAGDSLHGVTSADDMFSRLVLSCAVVRAHPVEAALGTNLLPVDVAARALIALALADDERIAYHLHHHTDVSVARFVAVHDPDSEPVPLTEWLARVRRASRELPIRPYEPSLLELARFGTDHVHTAYHNEITLRQLESLGVPIPHITDELIARYWDFLTREGHGG